MIKLFTLVMEVVIDSGEVDGKVDGANHHSPWPCPSIFDCNKQHCSDKQTRLGSTL